MGRLVRYYPVTVTVTFHPPSLSSVCGLQRAVCHITTKKARGTETDIGTKVGEGRTRPLVLKRPSTRCNGASQDKRFYGVLGSVTRGTMLVRETVSCPRNLTKHHIAQTYGEVEVQLHAVLISALDRGEWSASRQDHFPPKKEPRDQH
jgi:hypothetical protein